MEIIVLYFTYYSSFVNTGGVVYESPNPKVHIGTFQDSVLVDNNQYISDAENYVSRGICYFPFKDNTVEFYSWSPEGFKVFIVNSGTSVLTVQFSWGTFELATSERIDLYDLWSK